MRNITKGFTLMELLIVIGVLGILAAGLLAAIDPFEQLKKARDTNNRSAAIELLGASQRYYATHGYLPWYKGAGNPIVYDAACPAAPWGTLRPATAINDFTNPNPVIAISKANQAAADDTYGCINSTLGVDGEIKSSFFDGLASKLYVISGNSTRVVVCFPPEGKSNLSDAATSYAVNDLAAPTTVKATCTAADKLANLCLQCFQ